MKILVTYFSQTGNTKKIAEAIYSELHNEKEIKEMGDVDSLDAYDIVFVGMPVHAFGPAKAAQEFLEQKAHNKKIAVFITHAALEDMDETKEWVAKASDAASKADVIGTFHCQGELSEPIANFLKNHEDPQMQFFGNSRNDTIGQPDDSRIQKAKEFAREVLSKF